MFYSISRTHFERGQKHTKLPAQFIFMRRIRNVIAKHSERATERERERDVRTLMIEKNGK